MKVSKKVEVQALAFKRRGSSVGMAQQQQQGYGPGDGGGALMGNQAAASNTSNALSTLDKHANTDMSFSLI